MDWMDQNSVHGLLSVGHDTMTETPTERTLSMVLAPVSTRVLPAFFILSIKLMLIGLRRVGSRGTGCVFLCGLMVRRILNDCTVH